jgi:hypothetical protein
MDIGAAVEFVHSQGDEVELSRLEYILNQVPPKRKILDDLFAGQRQDGGCSPFWAQDYSSLDATCFRLAQAEQLGVTSSEPAVKRAVEFLHQSQRSDGSWEEAESVRDVAPHWVMPGDLSAKLYLTANCGFWLLMFQDDTQDAEKAAIFLRKHLGGDGRMPTYVHSYWMAVGLWQGLGWGEPAETVLIYLETRLGDISASALAWLIVALRMGGVPSEIKIIGRALGLLEGAQCDDGCWSSEDGRAFDVNATLEALRAFKLCGHI